MKKTTVILKWFQIKISKILASDKPNLQENEEKIMELFKWGNGTKLSTQERLKLIRSVNIRLNNEISKTKNEIISDLGAINEFDGTSEDTKYNELQQRVKEHVNNPIFDIPVNEYEIIEFEPKKTT